MPQRSATAEWNGTLPEGNGTMNLASGAYQGAYTFESRFEEGDGTNPEELIAAAHAGCFSMALSGNLGRAGYDPERVATEATVSIDRSGDGFKITSIRLETTAKVAGVEEAEFLELVEQTKTTCPVSMALAAVESIEVDAKLA
jgi:osmotically inducible protein OsmC